MVLVCAFVLAFCSIVYELLLGQTLSAFLGDTVLRYSVTIGLYMASMGVGALAVRGGVARRPVVSLQVAELGLSVLGGAAVFLVMQADATGVGPLALSVLGHGLVIVIGLLTGLEIPLLIRLQGTTDAARSGVLGIDYLGAFVGTVTFALWFYPRVGLVDTALTVACLNGAIGVGMAVFGWRVDPTDRTVHRGLLGLQALVLAAGLLTLGSL